MLVKISEHLKKLAEHSSAVKKQFFPSSKEKVFSSRAFIDPLLEDTNKKVKGLVHKYPKRVLVELTMNCASYCRFCTRRRQVSDIEKGTVSLTDIKKMTEYIKTQPKINEIIFSGGDPLTVPHIQILALKEFSKLAQIKIIRIHTRLPVSNPKLLTKELLNSLSKINNKKTLYLSIHFEHPDELTSQTIRAIKSLKKTGAILLSQSVFLKGINDSYKTLETLFSRLSELGIRPYYIYHCDLVRGVEHFIVPIKKEISLMTKLRKNISGIAFPFHVVDTPNGAGKIPAPMNFWKFESSCFNDFKNKKIEMY